MSGRPPRSGSPDGSADAPWGYSIREAAAKLGVPIHKLRRWDESGVLPATRTPGGHRRYSRDSIDGLANPSRSLPPADSASVNAPVREAIGEQRRIVHLLLEKETRYRDLVETSHDLIWETDTQGRFVYLNAAALEIFGLAPDALLGRCFFDFEASPAHIANRRFLATLRRDGEVRNFVTHLIGVDGRSRWISINARGSMGEGGQISGIRGTARDVTDQHAAYAELDRLARTDALTGLPNRASLQRTLADLLASGGTGALIACDIDGFRRVAKAAGHEVGDRVLQGLASVLSESARRIGGEVFRLGGDQFGVVVRNAAQPQLPEAVDALLGAVRRFRMHHPDGVPVESLTASAGVALYPFHGAAVADILANADMALYRAKDLGRNRYMIFDDGPDGLRGRHRRAHWARRIQDALDEDRICIYRQPVLRLGTRLPVHYEVLARIRESDGSVTPAGEFVPVAETIGLAAEIDLRVCEKLLEALERAPDDTAPLRHFVNLSAESFRSADWTHRLAALLRNSPVDPGLLAFEIPEAVALSRIDSTLAFASCVREMGSRFALDAFGAGLSSFYYLQRLDVDYLKIVGALVHDLAGDPAARVFVRALNDIAGNLGKQVVAAGIESPEAVDSLVSMGVLYGQGYLLGMPETIPSRSDRGTRRGGTERQRGPTYT
jgi:diguanylate cyclase (GGDEF)-like protein/PAS domain S-box-containing protein/excisionase family DNA binding protein